MEILSYQVITSGTNGELLVKEIYQLKHIYSIHIFCENVDYHKKWASSNPKVFSIDNEFHQLKANLEKKLELWPRERSSLRTDLPSYTPLFDDVQKNKNADLRSYLKGVLCFENRNQAKKDFLDLAQAFFGESEDIKDFEKNYDKYNMSEILCWFLKESFFYRITNNCLRLASPDAIYCCRFALQDLAQAIKRDYQQKSKYFSGLLFKGAYMSDHQWNNLVSNIGKDIEIYPFLSTCKKRKIALDFIKNEIDKTVMTTIIVPDAPERGDQGFVEIKEYSKYPDEEEVIFNLMSRFTILDARIEEFNEGIRFRHLVLLYGAQALKKFTFESPPVQIRTQDLKKCNVCGLEITILNSPLVLVNPILCNEYSCLGCLEEYKAEKTCAFICISPSMCTKSLNIEIKGFVMKNKEALDIPFYGSRCQKCDKKNLKYCSKCITCEVKKEYCEKCFYQNDCIQQNHVMILETQPFSFWSEKMSEKEWNYLNSSQIDKLLGEAKDSS